MFTWLGSLVHSSLAYVLHILYLTMELLQYLALSVLSFFSSSVAYISGIFLPIIANNETTEDTQSDTEGKSVGFIAWASSFSVTVTELASEVYLSLSEGIQASGNWLWTSWLWLVLTVGEAITYAAVFVMWLLASLWSIVVYLISSLWTGLLYIIVGIGGFLSSTAITVYDTSYNVTSGAKQVSGTLFVSSFG